MLERAIALADEVGSTHMGGAATEQMMAAMLGDATARLLGITT